MREIAKAFPLPWSHYDKLLALDDENARRFYEEEALRGGWSVRQLNRQINSQFYARTLLSKNKAAMLRKGAEPMGVGFAFVGRQVRLDIGGDEYAIDLLFYHLRLRCFFVIDLKMKPFKPEDAGKMNFYLSAVDDLMRHPDDGPSIGLLLCRDRNGITAEYALRDIGKPIGVAEWQTRLVDSLPPELQGRLPSIEDLEKELR